MNAIMYNATNFTPFIFHFNPETINNTKNANWHKSPNIGGSSKKNYFTGFDNRELSFRIMLLDFVSTTGVRACLDWFEQLSEPDTGWEFADFLGNENYPPPQVYFQYGYSLVPLKWDVMSVSMSEDIFKDGDLEFIGLPERAYIDITLELDTDDITNKANMIAKKMGMISGSFGSLYKEFQSQREGTPKQYIGII